MEDNLEWSDEELDQFSKDYDSLRDDLEPFVDRLFRNWDSRKGWLRPLTPEEQLFSDLRYFYNAAICNESAVFTYVDFMIEHREQLEAIGAHGCLAALDVLVPLYREMEKLPDEQHRAYRDRNRHDIEAGEALTEKILEFGRLLLRYANENSARIG